MTATGFDFGGLFETTKVIIFKIMVMPFELIHLIPEPIRIGFVIFMLFVSLVILYACWRNREKWRDVYWY